MKRFFIIAMLMLAAAGSPVAKAAENGQPSVAQEESSVDSERIKIGIAASVQGSVRLTGANRGPVTSGMAIHLNDRIITGQSGSLQVLLLDETVFTLGPNSDMVIDEFVYDPKTSEGSLVSKITKGVFRFITGKIARKNPKKMNVNLQSGTIGIRGTIVAGSTGSEGSTVILAGPGVRNNAGERPGAVYVSGTQGQENNGVMNGYFLNSPGEGTTISPEGVVGEPHMMTDELAQLNGILDNKSEGNDSDDKTDLDEGDSQNKDANDSKEDKKKTDEGEGNKDQGDSDGNNDNQENSQTDEEKGGESSEFGDMSEQSGEGDSSSQEDAGKQTMQNDENASNTASTAETKQEKTINDIISQHTNMPIDYSQMGSEAGSFSRLTGVTRARYEINDKITGKTSDGTVVTRGFTFSTVMNFLDKYFQDIYLKIYNTEDLDESYFVANNDTDDIGKYYPVDGSDDDKVFHITYSGSGNVEPGSGEYRTREDPILGDYTRFDAALSFYNNGSNTGIFAELTVSTEEDPNALTGGVYDAKGSIYSQGPMTIGEWNFVKDVRGITSAVYNVNGILNAQDPDVYGPMPDLGMNFMATLNFADKSISDMVLTFTPDNDPSKGYVKFYSDGVTTHFTNGETYKEMGSLSIIDSLKTNGTYNKINNIQDSWVEDIYFDDYTAIDVSLVNVNSPSMKVDVRNLVYSTNSVRYGGELFGNEYTDYDDLLTMSQFSKIAGNVLKAGVWQAKYTLDSVYLRDSAGNLTKTLPYESGSAVHSVSVNNFVSILDFESRQVKNTRFTITDNISSSGSLPDGVSPQVVAEFQQTSDVDIKPYLGVDSNYFPEASFSKYIFPNNSNATAGAVLDDSNSLETDNEDIHNVLAELYFTKPEGSSPLPGMSMALSFDYAINGGTYTASGNFGTYDGQGWLDFVNISGTSIDGDTLVPVNTNSLFAPLSSYVNGGNDGVSVPEQPMMGNASYSASGMWTDNDGKKYNTVLTATFDFLNASYYDAKVSIQDAANMDNINYYNADGGIVTEGEHVSIPFHYDSLTSIAPAIDDGVYNNPDNVLDADIAFHDEGLDVPSITAVLSPMSESSVFSGKSGIMYGMGSDFSFSEYENISLVEWISGLNDKIMAGGYSSLEATWNKAINISDGNIYSIIPGVEDPFTLRVNSGVMEISAAYNIILTEGDVAHWLTIKGSLDANGASADVNGLFPQAFADISFVKNAGTLNPDVIVDMTIPVDQTVYTGKVFHTDYSETLQ